MKYENVSCVEAITRILKCSKSKQLTYNEICILTMVFGSSEMSESIIYLRKIGEYNAN